MLIAMLLPVIIGMIGLAVDAGNVYMTHTRLQAATDAAALAGSLELPADPDLNQGKVVAAATNMLTANMPEAAIESVSPGGETRSVEVKSKAQVQLMIMDALGLADPWVRASAAAGFNNLEVVFVLDNTGSMKGAPINAVKEATEGLINLILPEGKTVDSKIGIVGFRGKVRLSAGVDGLPAGCRNADGSENKGIHPDFMPLYWALSSTRRSQVDLETCQDIPEIQPLSDDRDALLASLATHTALGNASGTVISEGIKWGRNVLTPEAPFTQGNADPKFRKIMVLLTDGDTEDGKCGGSYAAAFDPNNYWTNAYYGMGDKNSHCENGGKLNAAMLSEAQKAKDAGIEIFSIRYGSSDSVDVGLMKSVASSKEGTTDHYFDAPSTADIDDVFKQIGRQLGWRLLK